MNRQEINHNKYIAAQISWLERFVSITIIVQELISLGQIEIQS